MSGDHRQPADRVSPEHEAQGRRQDPEEATDHQPVRRRGGQLGPGGGQERTGISVRRPWRRWRPRPRCSGEQRLDHRVVHALDHRGANQDPHRRLSDTPDRADATSAIPTIATPLPTTLQSVSRSPNAKAATATLISGAAATIMLAVPSARPPHPNSTAPDRPAIPEAARQDRRNVPPPRQPDVEQRGEGQQDRATRPQSGDR